MLRFSDNKGMKLMEKFKDNLPLILALIPILAFLASFYSEHNVLKANFNDLENERIRIMEKLDRISEKLNIIDGKISEHMRVSK